MAKVRKSFRLSEDVAAILANAATEKGCSEAQIIEEALRRYESRFKAGLDEKRLQVLENQIQSLQIAHQQTIENLTKALEASSRPWWERLFR